MYQRILVPTDGSSLSTQAAEAAVAFARAQNAELVAVSVAQPYPLMAAEAAVVTDSALESSILLELAQENVAKVAQLAAAAGVPCQTVTALSFFPHEDIIKAALEHRCDLIVMGSHGRRGVKGVLLGSETQKVLVHGSIPVLVYR